MDALTAGPSMTRRPSGGGWSFDTPGPDVPAQPEPGAGLSSPGAGPATARPAPGHGVLPARDGRPATGPGVPSPRDPYPVGPYPVGPTPGRPPYRHDGPAAGRPATGEPAAPGPGSAGAVPAMAGLVRPVPLGAAPPPAPPRAPAGTAPAQAGTRNDTGRDAATDDGIPAEAGAGITPVVIPAEPAARAARRPVLFSVAGGDTPPRPTARQVTSAAQDATGPADPRAAEPAEPADPAQHRPSARSPTRRHLPPGRRRHPPRRGRRPRPRPSRPPRGPGPRTPDDRGAGGGRTRTGCTRSCRYSPLASGASVTPCSAWRPPCPRPLRKGSPSLPPVPPPPPSGCRPGRPRALPSARRACPPPGRRPSSSSATPAARCATSPGPRSPTPTSSRSRPTPRPGAA